MGRQRTKLNLSVVQQAQARHQFKTTQDARDRERLRFALRAATGRHTLEELARITGRSRSTLQNWLSKFAVGGIESLLQRDTPPGTVSLVARLVIQSQLREGLKTGRWTSAAAIAGWLQTAHGIKRSRKSLYYWLNKNGWRAPGAKS